MRYWLPLFSGPVAKGFRQQTLASNLGPHPPKKNPTTWMTQDQVPYVPKYSQATPRQKYIYVKFPINCHVAQWLRGLSDGHWPQIRDLPKIPPCEWWRKKWLLLSNHTSLGRLGSAVLVGSQSRRRTTLIWNPKVPGVLDRLDVWRPWVHGHVCASRNHAPAIGQLPTCFWGRFLSQRLGEGHSDTKPTASWSPHSSQPAEPLWWDP